MAKERLYKGVSELRDSLTSYVKMAGEGALVIIRNRNKEILAVLTSKEILELCDSGTPLPHEFYAAFMRREEISLELMRIILRVSYESAEKILAAAKEISKFDAAKRKAKQGKKPEPEPAALQELTELREERIRAQARARTKAAIEQRNKEKLAEIMAVDIKPTSVEALSIRHTVKE